MISAKKLDRLRESITEGLRVQRGGDPIEYIDAGTALKDACAKQNHAIFARRGCGKTLLLQHSSRNLKPSTKAIYLNCEDFKRHSFPNVLIEILRALFSQLERNLPGWFGKKKKARDLVKAILLKLSALQKSADVHDEEVRRKNTVEGSLGVDASVSGDVDGINLKFGAKSASKENAEIERSFKLHREKLQELDRWLPELKEAIREFFEIVEKTDALILQIDDLYHLRRTDQAFVIATYTGYAKTFHSTLRWLPYVMLQPFMPIAMGSQSARKSVMTTSLST